MSVRQLRAMVYIQVLAAAFSGLKPPAFCQTLSMTSCTSSSAWVADKEDPARAKALISAGKMTEKAGKSRSILAFPNAHEAFTPLVGSAPRRHRPSRCALCADLVIAFLFYH